MTRTAQRLSYLAPAISCFGLTLTACSPTSLSVQAGASRVITQPTHLARLSLAEGSHLSAAPGQELTLTVNGVETGIGPGTYTGAIDLIPTAENLVNYSFQNVNLVHHFRQALYLDSTGIVAAKSVQAAAGKFSVQGPVITGVNIISVGEKFNGVYAAGGTHTIKDAVIDFTGSGGNDFAGYGAAVMATGQGTTLVLDGARIHSRGVIRTPVVADNGSHLIVKNSEIQCQDGQLPADYVPNVSPGEMLSAPWMLGIAGNCRATNMIGTHTQATYINSSISTENWGTLSNDISDKPRLTVIDSKVEVTGKSGYAAYSMAGATTSFYGADLKGRDFGLIVDAGGSHVLFGASTPETVAKCNAELGLGLTTDELRSLSRRNTTVRSDRFGVLLHASIPVPTPPTVIDIRDDTVFETGQTVFLVKAVAADITVDGAQGAQLHPGNGVILQVMDSDDPGPVLVNGAMLNQGVYHEPQGKAALAEDFDTHVSHETDVHATFANITLKGDFYNAFRDGTGTGKMGAPPPPPSGKNLVLKFQQANLTGVISAARAQHAKDVIMSADYRLLGEVTNTTAPGPNNGVVVSLAQSTWTLTGTSYLTSLTLDNASKIAAAPGSKVTLNVNGRPAPIKAGTYQGSIVLTVNKT